MSLGETIIARASAPGPARRALIRISGPQTASCLETLGISDPARRGATLVRASIFDHDDLPLLLVRFVAPASYTGEEGAELLIPANHSLVEIIIDRCCELESVRRAEPGEFSARAYLAGKLTLAQAEGVGAKIAAEHDAARAAADRVLSGQAGREHEAWVQTLANALARVEAGIDFTDQEDVVAISSRQLGQIVRELRDQISSSIGSAFRAWASDRPLVALVGEPNAGKSTLFNALLGRERVVESPVRGTTRDVIIESVDLSPYGGGMVDLADLPGLEQVHPDEHSRNMHAHALAALEHADLILACDPRGRFDQIPSSRVPVLRIRTMADRHLSRSTADLNICALDGWHLETLCRRISAELKGVRRADDSAMIPRHRHHAQSAMGMLDSAIRLLDQQPENELGDMEVIAGLLRGALDELGTIAGQVSPDDIIGRIFSTFCIGK